MKNAQYICNHASKCPSPTCGAKRPHSNKCKHTIKTAYCCTVNENVLCVEYMRGEDGGDMRGRRGGGDSGNDGSGGVGSGGVLVMGK